MPPDAEELARVDRLAREFIAEVYGWPGPDSNREIYDAHDMRAAFLAGYQQGAGGEMRGA